MDMPKVKVTTLKQSPYVCTRNDKRVDPTRQGVEKAIQEGRFCVSVMDQDYATLVNEVAQSTQDPNEIDRRVHEYHNERIAELVRTKEVWLDKPDAWPIKANQFNQVIEGNHRLRAIRYLELDEVEVEFVQEAAPRYGYDLAEIW
jgi:hypothetical protein